MMGRGGEGRGGEGGLGLVPHQSAIYKALFGVWAFNFFYFFFNVRSEKDAPHSDFSFFFPSQSDVDCS